MTTGWVPIFDQSFRRVPISRLHEMYDDGFPVMAGYAGGGSSTKWLTAAEINAWFALGPDTGVLALFEGVGTEAINNPTLGDDNAKAARTAWRLRGYPDDCAISPAVDRNISVAQAKAAITQYFTNWNKADTCKPIPYIEKDGGAILFAEKLTAGTGTPAAFSWDPSDTLVTPDNAPSHVVWTQEHNSKAMAGGIVDIGHIRLTAPIQWKGKPVARTLSDDDFAEIRTIVWSLTPPAGAGDGDVIPNNSPFVMDSPAHTPPGTNPTTGAGFALGRIRTILEEMEATKPTGNIDIPTLANALAPLIAAHLDLSAIAVAVAQEIDRRMDA